MTGYLPLGFEFAAEITYPEAIDLSNSRLDLGVYNSTPFQIIYLDKTKWV